MLVKIGSHITLGKVNLVEIDKHFIAMVLIIDTHFMHTKYKTFT